MGKNAVASFLCTNFTQPVIQYHLNRQLNKSEY